MENFFNKILLLIISFFSITVADFLGGWDEPIKILVIFIVGDFIIGISKAFITKTLSSKVSFRGLVKKTLCLILVGIGEAVDRLTHQEVMRNLVVTFYVAQEFISIIENLKACGVKVPNKLIDAINTMRDEEDKEKDDKDSKEDKRR